MTKVRSDLEIAQDASMLPITQIGEKIGIPAESLIPYGHDKAKISYDFHDQIKDRPDGKLILVTAISPTPASHHVR